MKGIFAGEPPWRGGERLELLQEPTGTWAVFDEDSGLPVVVDGRLLIGLSYDDAVALIGGVAATLH